MTRRFSENHYGSFIYHYKLFLLYIVIYYYVLFVLLGLWPGLCRSHKDFLKIFYHSTLQNRLIFECTEFEPDRHDLILKFLCVNFSKMSSILNNPNFRKKNLFFRILPFSSDASGRTIPSLLCRPLFPGRARQVCGAASRED